MLYLHENPRCDDNGRNGGEEVLRKLKNGIAIQQREGPRNAIAEGNYQHDAHEDAHDTLPSLGRRVKVDIADTA